MESCDVLLMLGTDFPYNDWYPKRAKIAQVDIRPEYLGVQALPPRPGTRWRREAGTPGPPAAAATEIRPVALDECLKHYSENTKDTRLARQGHRGAPSHPPEYLTAVISELADEDAVFARTTACAPSGQPDIFR